MTSRKIRDTIRAVIYLRISDDKAGEALGVERQRKACAKLAKAEGFTVVDVLTDNDISASSGKRRPGFERLLDLIAGGDVDVIVAYHPDRLYRRLADLGRLVDVATATRNRVDFRTVAAGDIDLATASGRMIANILGSTAQAEVERMGERVAAKHAELAAAGKVPGGPTPFGFTREAGTFIVNETAARAVQMMARRILEGATLAEVARELDAQGVPTPSGGFTWGATSVRSALRNPAVAGLRIHRREVVGPGTWPAIIDQGTWEAAKAVLADPARKRRRPHVYPLSGLTFTGHGDRMLGRPEKRADGTVRRTYTGQGAGVGHRTAIDADTLEAFVYGAVLAETDDVALPVADDVPAGDDGTLAKLEADMAELSRLHGEGVISQANWLAALTPLQKRVDAARRDAGRATIVPNHLRLLAKPGAVRAEYEAGRLTGNQWRDVVAAVVPRIVVKSTGGNRHVPVEDRVTFPAPVPAAM